MGGHDWMDGVRGLYRDLDAELARREAHCDGCGECCRFERAEHVLYASALERRFLALAPMPERSDATPELLAAGHRCPFQADGACRAREWRVLGCRLHFCRWSSDGEEGGFAERWHERLKALHDEVGEGWDYRRLLPMEGTFPLRAP